MATERLLEVDAAESRRGLAKQLLVGAVVTHCQLAREGHSTAARTEPADHWRRLLVEPLSVELVGIVDSADGGEVVVLASSAAE